MEISGVVKVNWGGGERGGGGGVVSREAMVKPPSHNRLTKPGLAGKLKCCTFSCILQFLHDMSCA